MIEQKRQFADNIQQASLPVEHLLVNGIEPPQIDQSYDFNIPGKIRAKKFETRAEWFKIESRLADENLPDYPEEDDMEAL